MTRHTASLPASYFDSLYEQDADPWRFASSEYERDKYAATLAALPRLRYGSALEVGCSIGVLTRQLASRCDALFAVDLAAAALDQARIRCSGLPHVRFDLRRVPAEWPGGRYDLILLSEVLYYLDRTDLASLASRVRKSLLPGGHIVLVHWLGETHYPLSGDEAAGVFIDHLAEDAAVHRGERTQEYRLDVLGSCTQADRLPSIS